MPSALTLTSFLRGALRRLPLETAVVALAAITAIHSNHVREFGVWHARLLLTAVLALPLVFALHERLQRHALAGGAAITGLVGVLSLRVLRDGDSLDSPSAGWAVLLLALAAYLVPFVAAAPRFSPFVRRFFEEVSTWVLVGGCALIAIAVIGYTVEALFTQSTENFTLDVMVLVTAAISLVVLDRLLPDRATGGKVPELWRRLATAIGAPFVSLMLIILVVYEVTVLVRGELPSNLLSPLLVAAGFIGYLCTLIISAVAAEPVGTAALSPAEPHRFLRNRSVQLARAFPLALLVLLPMALWALYVRIEQYGLTPFRVVRLAALLCLVVLGLLGSWRWLRHRAALGWHVPATIAAFAIPFAIGPLSAVNLSLRSQTARVERLLTAAGVTTRHVGPPATVAAHTISRERWYELNEAIEQLYRLGGTAGVQRVLEGEIEACAHLYDDHDCLRSLGLAAEDSTPTGYSRSHQRQVEQALTIPAGQLTRFSFENFASPEDVGKPSVAGTPAEPSTAYLDCGDGWASVSIAHLLTSKDPEAPLPLEPLIPRSVNGTGCANPGKLFVTTLGTETDDTGRHAYHLFALWIR